MSKSDAFETDLLGLIYNAAAIQNIADNAATAPLTALQVTLHTADPGEAGDQTTSEVAYTGFARVAVARDTTGWTVTGNSVSPVNPIEFVEAPVGTTAQTATHASVGVNASGVSKILHSGALSPTISISDGVIPRIKITSAITED